MKRISKKDALLLNTKFGQQLRYVNEMMHAAQKISRKDYAILEPYFEAMTILNNDISEKLKDHLNHRQ